MKTAIKEDLIHKLAMEYGMDGRPKRDDSHYDRNTGTLFVGKKVYHYEDFDRAARFLKENKKKAKSFGDASYDLYEIAEFAVRSMMENNLSVGGRVINDT